MLRGGCVARSAVRSVILADRYKAPSTWTLFITPCQGCTYRRLTTSNVSQGRFPLLPSFLATRGSLRTMTSTSGTEEKSSPPEGAQTSSASMETIVKVQPTVKVKPPRKKTDFSKSYQDNVFITPLRAMTDYVLKPEDLEDLTKYKRRSPYPESQDITVFFKRDVENKAVFKWGSNEKLNREKERVRTMNRMYNKYVSMAKRSLRDYQLKHGSIGDELPLLYSPLPAGSLIKQNESLFKSGPGKVVVYAILVNAANAVLKLLAWMHTGSHSMFAESIHSMADTANQLILAVGLHQSLKQADTEHPYGWSNFRNVASLISGVGIFCLGAGFSIYHGVAGLLHPQPIESLNWAIAILAGSFISEGATLVVAINEVRHSAKEQKMSFREYVSRGIDPSTNVVLLEDAAAVLGVMIAAGCMSITSYTGSPLADTVGSLVIGSLLGGVASFIIYTNTIALVGRSIPLDKKAELMRELEDDRMIRALHDVKATEMGGSSVKFKAEVDFDGKEITRLYLEKQDLEKMLNDMSSMRNVDSLETFMLKHGENIVDTLGGEVDRIEKNLKKKHPEVRHVDLEQL